jgi:hypothetical protein
VNKIERATDVQGLLKAFNPTPLDGDDLNTFFYRDTMPLRTGDKYKSPLKMLFMECISPSTANAHLLMGHVGCGKSTELRNLQRDFINAGHRTHIVDTVLETEPHLINQWDILLLITEGLCKLAEGTSADIDAPLERIYNILLREIVNVETLERETAASGSVEGSVQSPPLMRVLKLFLSLKGNLRVSEQVRTEVSEKMPKRASEWLIYTKEISARLTEALGQKQPIIIFEDLDKLPVPERIFELFSYSVLADMPFPIIYTFPIDQFYSTSFGSIRGKYKHHLLPMIKISNIDKTPNKKGIAALRKIVELRADLDLFGSGVLNLLISKTGGSLRHLFKCITNAAFRANWRKEKKIMREDANSALSELSKDLTRKITTSDYGKLQRIMDASTQIEDTAFLLNMVHASIVLEYENGERWQDVHPLVADFLERHSKNQPNAR